MSVSVRGRHLIARSAAVSRRRAPADVCRPLFVSTYAPTPCGIATFTRDLADGVDQAAGGPVSSVAAISKAAGVRSARVVHLIDNERQTAYRDAAGFCNDHACDVVCLQHEYGLYAGAWGEAVLDFTRACAKPLVTTLHTLSLHPERKARHIVRDLARTSEQVVVMARLGARILTSIYGLPPEKISYIPHGVHPLTFPRSALLRHRMSIPGRPVLLTFGLLGPGKGIEYMIEALPAVLRRYPGAVYLVVGRTHPGLGEEGERYREQLKQRARRARVADRLLFDDRFLSLRELLLHLHSADVYVTPYIERNQITSGTLAYALAAGKAIVSTPYLYAEEMADRGAVLLADFRDGASLAAQVLRVLDRREVRASLEDRARTLGTTMRWSRVGAEYYALFQALASRTAGWSGLDMLRDKRHAPAHAWAAPPVPLSATRVGG